MAGAILRVLGEPGLHERLAAGCQTVTASLSREGPVREKPCTTSLQMRERQGQNLQRS